MKPAARYEVLLKFSAVVVLGLVGWLIFEMIGRKTAPDFRESPASKVEARALIFELPEGWRKIPGKISPTYRSSRPGAGFFQLSLHPPLPQPVDGPGAERELASLLAEMKSEMPFGKRSEIGHVSARGGVLAFARYESPDRGTLAFWLLPTVDLVFATYIGGGSIASAADIREAQEALRSARYE